MITTPFQRHCAARNLRRSLRRPTVVQFLSAAETSYIKAGTKPGYVIAHDPAYSMPVAATVYHSDKHGLIIAYPDRPAAQATGERLLATFQLKP